MYREWRDKQRRLHRTDGPAVEAAGRREWWVEGRRHRPDGPAIETDAGTRWYYWRGLRVPRVLIEAPRSLTPAEILAVENVEIRRAWIEAYGLREFIRAGGGVLVHADFAMKMKLWKMPATVGDAVVYLEVKDSTGGQTYYLRVPPDMKRCRAAVAWTFGLEADQYAPRVQT